MKIIEFNHKTATSLLKKQVKEHWLDGKDAWLKFTDGTVVRIHQIKPTWTTYVTLTEPTKSDRPCFQDDQSIWYFHGDNRDPYTSRIVSIYFDKVRYYCHNDYYNYRKRDYLPVVELHYYEKGEYIGNHNS